MDQGISLCKISDSIIPKLKYQVFYKYISKLKKILDVTLYASDIIASEKLVEFSNILLSRYVALGNLVPLVKRISEIKWWHIFIHKFVLHIFSSFNQYLKLGFPISFHICPILACLSSQFRGSESDFLQFRERVLDDVSVHAI